jgi:hypothetical protein
VAPARAHGDEILAVALTGGPDRAAELRPRPEPARAPALDGSRLVFHVAGRDVSRIVEVDLATGARTDLRRETRAR